MWEEEHRKIFLLPDKQPVAEKVILTNISSTPLHFPCRGHVTNYVLKNIIPGSRLSGTLPLP